MASQFSFQKILDKLVPQQEFAGLEVGDKFLRFLLFSHYDLSVLTQVEVNLEPGTIEKGELKRPAGLQKALEELRAKIQSPAGEHVSLVVSLPSALCFFNVLELPDVSSNSFNETVRLNASQISPLRLSDAYLDWQNLGVNLKTLQREFLVGIADRSKIDSYLDIFTRAGFEVIALESRSLSLMRLFSYFSQTIEKNINALFIDVGSDGLSLVLGKQGKLYFDFFLYWSEIPEAQDGNITRDDLENILGREIMRVLEFAGLHYDEKVSYFVLFAPVLAAELAQFISAKFSLRNIGVKLPEIQASGNSQLWAGVIGVSLRGSLVPRESDDIISLLPEGTEQVYQQNRLAVFVSLWGKISAFTLIGLLLVNAGVYFALARQKENLEALLTSIQIRPELNELRSLEQDADEFNQQLAQLEKIQQETVRWSEYLEPILQVVKEQKIVLARVSFSENSSEVRLRGLAPSQKSAVDFGSALESRENLFAKVELPLSSISQTTQGVSFEAVVSLKK